MYYIEIATGTRVSIYAIRTLHPHMSIPDGADLADLGYAPIVLDSTPLLAPGESYAPGQLQQEGSIWRQTWVILPPPDPAILIAEKTEMLWAAADRYTSQYISGGAFGMLAVGMMLYEHITQSALWGKLRPHEKLPVKSPAFDKFGNSVKEIQIG